MLNANQLLREGIEQVRSVGISPGLIDPDVVVNTRAKRQLGKCSKVAGIYSYVIEINKELLKGDKKKALNTMIHEILHSVKGCMNHGKQWQSYADKMNREFGYDISRTVTYEQAGLAAPKPKYVIQCVKCKYEYHRMRKSRIMTHIEEYSCGKCHGKLKLRK